MAEITPIAVGIIIPTLTAWLSDQLPKKGLSREENERRIKNIVLSFLVAFGVYYMVEKIKLPTTSVQATQTTQTPCQYIKFY